MSSYSVKHPLLIIGLDGASWSVLKEGFALDLLPHIRELVRSGWSAPLLSTTPPVTLPAWSSFLTAAHPSQHGVIDMMKHPPSSYDVAPMGGGDSTLPSFLYRLRMQGFRVASIGVPGTYPPHQHGNLCIAGFDAPGGNIADMHACYPKDEYSQLQAWGGWSYGAFNELDGAPQSIREKTEALLNCLAEKEKLFLHLLDQAWDVMMVHIQATDTISHHAWHTHDSTSPRRTTQTPEDAVLSIYQRIDTLIGKLKQSWPTQGRILLISDHGFGGADTLSIHINAWLHQKKLLQFQSKKWAQYAFSYAAKKIVHRIPLAWQRYLYTRLPQSIAAWSMRTLRKQHIAYPLSHAFSDEWDFGPSIWLNRRSRFLDGFLSDAEADTLQQNLAQDILTWQHPIHKKPLIEQVIMRDMLPDGVHRQQYPDLILVPAWIKSYRPSFAASHGAGPLLSELPIAAYEGGKGGCMPGVHHPHGIWILSGENISTRSMQRFHIAEAGASIYALLGLQTPNDLCIKPPNWLLEALQISSQSHHSDVSLEAHHPYTPDEAQSVANRLRAFGYID